MRVLHVLPTRAREYGGPVAVAEQIVGELRRRGVDASLFPADEENPGFGYATLRTLCHAVTQSDFVHIHGLWSFHATSAALISRWKGIPYIVTPHGMLDRWSLLRSRFKKLLYAFLFERRNLIKAAGVHFLNEEELSESREFEPRCRGFILPNGVKTDSFNSLPGREVFELRYSECRGRVLALFLGRLHPKKGFNILLSAFATALEQVTELHLIVAGPDEGGYLETLQAMTVSLCIAQRVTFTGLVKGEAKREVLGAADFFVLPSYQEGDSLAVKEAMAASLPVLITRACHMPEVAEQNCGLIVELNEGQVAEALIVLASDRNLLRTLGTNGRRLMEQKYEWKSITGQLIEIYGDILRGEFSSAPWRLR